MRDMMRDRGSGGRGRGGDRLPPVSRVACGCCRGERSVTDTVGVVVARVCCEGGVVRALGALGVQFVAESPGLLH